MDLLLFLYLFLVFICSFFIGRRVYKRWQKAENKWAMPFGILAFVLSALLIGIIVGYIILLNVNFGR